MDAVDVAVIGGGVVGAAVAHAVASAGFGVVLLEAGPRCGEGVTSRNSGVIHSGLYYPPASLKARLCVEGNALLYAWCAARNVWHSRCGKLVVANGAAQESALVDLLENARQSNAPGVTAITGQEAQRLEPSVPCTGALWCPQTGIVDPAELTQSLCNAAVDAGAMVLTHARVTSLNLAGEGAHLETSRGPMDARLAINAAGLFADEVARMAGISTYTVHPCRGDYFWLKGAPRFTHLVYPVKEKGAAGLGVHVTLNRDGAVRLGPDVTWVTEKEDHKAAPEKEPVFRAAAERLLGPIPEGALQYDSCGIRPKLRAPHEKDEKDFVISQDAPALINLVGIESPGLTASLAIARMVAGMASQVLA